MPSAALAWARLASPPSVCVLINTWRSEPASLSLVLTTVLKLKPKLTLFKVWFSAILIGCNTCAGLPFKLPVLNKKVVGFKISPEVFANASIKCGLLPPTWLVTAVIPSVRYVKTGTKSVVAPARVDLTELETTRT